LFSSSVPNTTPLLRKRGEPGSWVSMCLATGWTTGRSRFDPRQRRKDFFSNLCVQTGSGANPPSSTMGTGGPVPGTKARPGCDADHLPHLVPRSRMSRSYTSSPPSAFLACSGTALAFYYESEGVRGTPSLAVYCLSTSCSIIDCGRVETEVACRARRTYCFVLGGESSDNAFHYEAWRFSSPPSAGRLRRTRKVGKKNSYSSKLFIGGFPQTLRSADLPKTHRCFCTSDSA
jgi:hypothetical protein